MKNETIVTKLGLDGNMERYFVEVMWKQTNSAFSEPKGAYYVAVTPIVVIDGNDVYETKRTLKELLFEIKKETRQAQKVAESVADGVVNDIITEIQVIESCENGNGEMFDINFSDFLADMGRSYGEQNKTSFNQNQNTSKSTDKTMDGEYEAYIPKTSLSDIYGMEEVKVEINELIKGFTEKEMYEKFNVTPPQGVLMFGQPGCGKSVLAKAIAGEAKINFIQSPSASMAEKYVGTGAASVKKLFAFARKNTPAVLFFDEIDSIGSKRNEESKETSSTLNQLLMEISDKEKNKDLLIIGATNRPDILDDALTRTGRLDRKISIGLPDTSTRLGILELYAKNKPLAENVDLEQIARKTSGMSGSDMEAIITESCMLAIRGNEEVVTQEHLIKAINKMIVGLERKSTIMSEEEKKIVAIHEASHLICSTVVGGRVPTQISLIPTGDALGYVQYYEEGDKFIHTETQLKALIISALGGKAGEFVFFNHLSSGCSGDLDSATNVATQMVTKYGMSRLGSICIKGKGTYIQEKIFEEVKFIIDNCYYKTVQIVKENKILIEKIAEELIIKEKLNEKEIGNILANLYNLGLSKEE